MTLVDAQELVVAGAPFGDVYERLPTAWRFAFKEWWLRCGTVPNRGVRNGKHGGEPWGTGLTGEGGPESGGTPDK